MILIQSNIINLGSLSDGDIGWMVQQDEDHFVSVTEGDIENPRKIDRDYLWTAEEAIGDVSKGHVEQVVIDGDSESAVWAAECAGLKMISTQGNAIVYEK